MPEIEQKLQREIIMKSGYLAVFLVFFGLLTGGPTCLVASEIEVESSISSVTLYTDRAEVVRTVSTPLPAGAQSLILRGIPHSISHDSIRASGSGTGATAIRGVEIKNLPLREDVSDEVQDLQQQLLVLQRDLQSLQRRRDVLVLQQKLVSDISLDAPGQTKGQGSYRSRTPQEMLDILKMIDKTQQRLDPELSELAEAIEKNSRETEHLRARLSALQPPRRQETVLVVRVYSEAESEVTLDVTYQVNNASWQPSYNLRTQGDSVTLERFAMITQRTGEPWEDISLTISTARPQVGLERPNPRPYFLNIIQPVEPQNARLESGHRAMALRSAGNEHLRIESADLAAPVAYQQAEMINASIVEFLVPSTTTIKSDGSTQTVFLNSNQLSGEIYHIATPALNNEVFREANLTNDSEAPILPGNLNVFADNRFVGKRTLGLIQPGQKFKLPLGLSDRIRITRKLKKRFEDDSGIIRSFRRVRDEFELEITNNSMLEAKIIVLEPTPVSQNEKIKVELSTPRPRPLVLDNSERINNQEGVLEWHFNLGPNSETRFGYSSTVEYPAQERVSGMPG